MKNKGIKGFTPVLLFVIFFSIFLLSACTVNLGALIVPRQSEYDWHCEELQITCLNRQFDGAGYAVIEYNGQDYTAEYYHETDACFDTATGDHCGAVYSLIQGFIDYDGNFYIKYSEATVVFDEQYSEYSWNSVFSQDLLIGDVKNRGSCIVVTVTMDNLYNGKYVGKTIRFEKV